MNKYAFTLAIFAAAAQAQHLDVKPGLWEVTTLSERSGAPPIPADALAKMPPEQRARIEAQIKSMSSPSTTTKQSCFTNEDVAKGFSAYNVEKSCKQTILSSSGNHMEIKWECEGQQKNSGVMKIDAPDSSHVNSRIDIVMGTMSMKISTTGKYLGAACGNVKPDTGKK
jgi:hypothetical protein